MVAFDYPKTKNPPQSNGPVTAETFQRQATNSRNTVNIQQHRQHHQQHQGHQQQRKQERQRGGWRQWINSNSNLVAAWPHRHWKSGRPAGELVDRRAKKRGPVDGHMSQTLWNHELMCTCVCVRGMGAADSILVIPAWTCGQGKRFVVQSEMATWHCGEGTKFSHTSQLSAY